MSKREGKIFLHNPFCRAVIISKRPLMREGLQHVMAKESACSSLVMLEDYSALSPEILQQVDVVVLELDNSLQEIFNEYGPINHLQTQYRHIHWIFILPVQLVNIAIERLLTAKTSLLSLHEPMSSIIEHVFNRSGGVDKISLLLLQEKAAQAPMTEAAKTSLTFSERRVLRLISKGWQMAQIATLLEKNYKTVSAQKSSAMRRLSIKTDAEKYAWMISESGMQELNFPPYSQGI